MLHLSAKRLLHEELERLRKEAIASFDRMLAALIEAIQLPLAGPASETTYSSFFARLMLEIFQNDIRLPLSSEDAGWGTINRFYSHCKKMYPGWASKQTFYHRMNESLYYLLEHGIAQERPIMKRLGMGRAEYEYRVNPNHPDIKNLASSPDSNP